MTNTRELRVFLDKIAHRHINTDSDSEVLLNILANNLQKTGKFRYVEWYWRHSSIVNHVCFTRINEEDIFTAIKDLYAQCRGAYACVAMIAGYGIIGFRDPHGIRPLVLGRRKTETGYDYMFASESVCLDALGFTDCEDVNPGKCILLTPVLYVLWLISISGEAIIITREQLSRRQLVPAALHTPCIFEYVYFARQDSIIDGISVYNARLSMGEALARQVEKIFGDKCDIDVVIPVSTLDIFMWMMKLMDHSFRFLIHPVLLLFKHLTSWIFFIVKASTRIVTLAELSSCLVSKLGKHWMTWKRYHLDWILMGVSSRKNVRRKLNAMTLEFQDKNVLLVDGKVSNITWSFQRVVLMITK